MAGASNVPDLEVAEVPADGQDVLVGHVVGLRTAHEQNRLVRSVGTAVPGGYLALHDAVLQQVQRQLLVVRRAHQRLQEQAHGGVWRHLFQDAGRPPAVSHVPYRPYVLHEFAAGAHHHWRILQAHGPAHCGAPQQQPHGHFTSHRVADDRRVLQPMLLHEPLHVRLHGAVGVRRLPGGVPVVAQVHQIHILSQLFVQLNSDAAIVVLVSEQPVEQQDRAWRRAARWAPHQLVRQSDTQRHLEIVNSARGFVMPSFLSSLARNILVHISIYLYIEI